MPFKYAQKEVKGIVYILSFGIGVAIVSPALVMCCDINTSRLADTDEVSPAGQTLLVAGCTCPYIIITDAGAECSAA